MVRNLRQRAYVEVRMMAKREPMRLSERFVDLREEFRRSDDRKGFFRDFASTFGLGHLAYFGVFPQWGEDQKHQLVTTYREDWEGHYFQKKYDRLDPVLLQTMRRVVPLDWEAIPLEDREVRDFFGEAGEFGVQRRGISIPIRGPFGDQALLAITSPDSKREWDAFKRHLLPDLVYLANLVHAEVTEGVREKGPEAETRLTAREKEVLSWSARGKTSWETARILSLSEKTVDFYLKNAIFKLRAANKTQAVSKAITQGSLTLPFRIDL